MAETGKDDAQGAAEGGAANERSDEMVAIAHAREDSQAETGSPTLVPPPELVNDIRTPEDVPESYLRLVNLVSALGDLGEEADALINDAGRVMETLGVPLFETDAQNEAVYKRANELRAREALDLANGVQVTLDAVRVFEACTYMAAVEEMFCTLEDAAPASIGDEIEGCAWKLLEAAFGPFPEDDEERDRHPIVTEYRAKGCEKAAQMLRRAASNERGVLSGEPYGPYTARGLRDVADKLELQARLSS
jgi:hypothetical protein